MLQLQRESLTREVYFDDTDSAMFTMVALFWTLVCAPTAFGFWFHSWWVWFGVLMLSISFTLVFFLVVNSFVIAIGFLVVFSLLWGGVGYYVGILVQNVIGWAPPALIVGILFYLVVLCLFIFPLINGYRYWKNKAQKEIEGKNDHLRQRPAGKEG